MKKFILVSVIAFGSFLNANLSYASCEKLNGIFGGYVNNSVVTTYRDVNKGIIVGNFVESVEISVSSDCKKVSVDVVKNKDLTDHSEVILGDWDAGKVITQNYSSTNNNDYYGLLSLEVLGDNHLRFTKKIYWENKEWGRFSYELYVEGDKLILKGETTEKIKDLFNKKVYRSLYILPQSSL